MTTSSSWEATRFWLHNSSRVYENLFYPTWRCEKFLKRRQSHCSLPCSLPRSRVPVSLRKRQRRYEQSRAFRRTCLKNCSEGKRRKPPTEPQKGTRVTKPKEGHCREGEREANDARDENGSALFCSAAPMVPRSVRTRQ